MIVFASVEERVWEEVVLLAYPLTIARSADPNLFLSSHDG